MIQITIDNLDDFVGKYDEIVIIAFNIEAT